MFSSITLALISERMYSNATFASHRDQACSNNWTDKLNEEDQTTHALLNVSNVFDEKLVGICYSRKAILPTLFNPTLSGGSIQRRPTSEATTICKPDICVIMRRWSHHYHRTQAGRQVNILLDVTLHASWAGDAIRSFLSALSEELFHNGDTLWTPTHTCELE